MHKTFNFGQNWTAFSSKLVSTARLHQAGVDLQELVGEKYLHDKTFLDIGCGSGLMSLAAIKLGAARAYGIDISIESIQAANLNKKKLLPKSPTTFSQLSILDPKFVSLKKFDVVYSWGVLHHTGSMYESIKLASEKVKPKGKFIIAIYNSHFTSPLWKLIKWSYNQVPPLIQKIYIAIFYWVIATAKFLHSGQNPFTSKRRGMSYYYDVIDWVGGYPYEYASIAQIVNFTATLGFIPQKIIKARVPTGCNQFVFTMDIK